MFTAGDFPLSVAVALDRSFSMTPARLAASVAAARSFVRGLRPDDRVMVMAVGSEVEVLAPLRPTTPRRWRALAQHRTVGHDAAVRCDAAAIDAIQSASGRRALILLSDGKRPATARSTAPALVEHARRKDVLVYPVALGEVRGRYVRRTRDGDRRTSFARPTRELAATLAAIANELRSQYLLGYSPVTRAGTRAASGGRFRCWSSGPTSRVRARDGYLCR